MELNHFETPQAVLEYITGNILWNLREDRAAMMGSQAEHYSDEEFAEVEDMIADIEAVAPALSVSGN